MTKGASDKKPKETNIFEFLFDTLKPELIFAHSKAPIEFFGRVTGCEDFEGSVKTVEWDGHKFRLFGRRGPLYTMGQENAQKFGKELASPLWALDDPEKADPNALTGIAKAFAERFCQWGMKVPRSDIERRRAGRFFFEGWWILFCFGADEKGEFMDYYADHRMMWGGEHVRLYENGDREVLPTPNPFLPISDDPVESARMEQDYRRHNQEINAMLAAKGSFFTDHSMINAARF